MPIFSKVFSAKVIIGSYREAGLLSRVPQLPQGNVWSAVWNRVKRVVGLLLPVHTSVTVFTVPVTSANTTEIKAEYSEWDFLFKLQNKRFVACFNRWTGTMSFVSNNCCVQQALSPSRYLSWTSPRQLKSPLEGWGGRRWLQVLKVRRDPPWCC